MLKRAILSLVPTAVAIAVCAICIWLPWEYLRLQHPDDPSVTDTFAWMMIYIAPAWIILLPLVEFTAWIIAYLVVRRISKRATAKINLGH